MVDPDYLRLAYQQYYTPADAIQNSAFVGVEYAQLIPTDLVYTDPQAYGESLERYHQRLLDVASGFIPGGYSPDDPTYDEVYNPSYAAPSFQDAVNYRREFYDYPDPDSPPSFPPDFCLQDREVSFVKVYRSHSENQKGFFEERYVEYVYIDRYGDEIPVYNYRIVPAPFPWTYSSNYGITERVYPRFPLRTINLLNPRNDRIENPSTFTLPNEMGCSHGYISSLLINNSGGSGSRSLVRDYYLTKSGRSYFLGRFNFFTSDQYLRSGHLVDGVRFEVIYEQDVEIQPEPDPERNRGFPTSVADCCSCTNIARMLLLQSIAEVSANGLIAAFSVEAVLAGLAAAVSAIIAEDIATDAVVIGTTVAGGAIGQALSRILQVAGFVNDVVGNVIDLRAVLENARQNRSRREDSDRLALINQKLDILLRQVGELFGEFPIVNDSHRTTGCDGQIFYYSYFGKGLRGTESQIQAIARQLTDIQEFLCRAIGYELEVSQEGINFIDCSEKTFYSSGQGMLGLSRQVVSLSNQLKDLQRYVCEKLDIPFATEISMEDCDGVSLYRQTVASNGIQGLISLTSRISLQISTLTGILCKAVNPEIVSTVSALDCEFNEQTQTVASKGLPGISQQLQLHSWQMQQMLIAVCKKFDIEVSGVLLNAGCDNSNDAAAYSGKGFIGIREEIEALNRIIQFVRKELCPPELTGEITITECPDPDNNDERRITRLPYQGRGLTGLESMANAISVQVQTLQDTVCTPATQDAIVLLPGEAYTELAVVKQLVIVFGTSYPKSEGSRWSVHIPNPIEGLDWNTHFENLSRSTGTVSGRIFWRDDSQQFTTKLWTGGYFKTEADANRFLDQMEALSNATASTRRISKRTGTVARNNPSRVIRAVRAFVAAIGEDGQPELLQSFCPPRRN